jgi:outer membrane protein OmpA-like peptidoglycan-associated protein
MDSPSQEPGAAPDEPTSAGAEAEPADAPGQQPPGGTGGPLKLSEVVAQGLTALVPVVVSGAGLAALLVGVGGAVSFARFYAAGLPANQAVNAATESDMEAIGLTWLVTAGLVGLFAILLAYIASPQGKATAAMYYALIAIATLEAGVAWQLAFADSGHNLRVRDALALAVLILTSAGAFLIVLRRHLHERGVLGKRDPDGRRVPSYGEVVGWVGERCRVRERKPAPPVSLAAKTKDADEKEEDQPLHLPLSDYLLLGILSLCSALLIGRLVGHWWVGLSIASAGALGLLTIRVAALNSPDNPRFRWYGVCVFFSVGLFGAVLGVFRMLDEPRLQPVAFLRTVDGETRAMQGVYVGESDDKLWFASVALDECGDNEVRRGSGRLRAVPEDEVSYLTIGPSMGLPKLAHEARAMLDDVRAEHLGREVFAGPEAVRDAVSLRELGAARKETGSWVEIGSTEDLGVRPTISLDGRPLRLRLVGDNWRARLPRFVSSGPIYASCSERTNPAWLTVRSRPFAVATATSLGQGWWRLDARGSFDPDGQVDAYRWDVGTVSIDEPTLNEVRAPAREPVARLVVTDSDGGADGLAGLTDTREVRLDDGAIARTFPSDLLFCRDCRRIRERRAMLRLRALRSDIALADRVHIRVHTDERGSAAYNEDLSRVRGKAVRRVLLAGVREAPPVRVQPVGEKEAEHEDGRQNRNIEVIVYRR